MPSSDLTDPTVAEADRRVERAKASLRSRFEQLEHRFIGVRDRLDVPEHIRRHPWPAVGIALALGVLAGRGGRAARSIALVASEPVRGRSGLGIFGKLAVRVVKELVIAQVGLAARRWLDQRASAIDESFHDVSPSYRQGFERYPAP